ncbi:MAG: thiolase domain-containing protein [Candidatus Latescibacteria bacterium]|nr:thiolase domain-containing protein [Candidatus Latescibacterota bacterium]NIM21750.1 thiolase domain-containing protein [Candidatus Latescibacterota bacterium]NIM65888.1 thiolase domain-containing protein [Candidatus Latescibacterota bacterium]NIO02633.1 thiolase domain-containing protein [Candidatus Latescibacterota bacterium]NIO29614.1 thiolase domain-containing protein [Candidatus Latescibacterota bacterium]
MREVAVIGVGIQKWGELWEKSLRDIFVESALNAMKDAGVDKIDSMYVGCMSSGLFTGQEHIASLLADYLGFNPNPAVRVESACASGGVAFRQGFIEVASGFSDVVLVGGVEKMTDVDGGTATYALGTAADQEYECYNGATFPGLYALIARAHMSKYGTTLEQLADVTVKNHDNGSLNPHAQYPFKVTREQVMTSTMVADPLRILHCSGITDGAAAAILAPVELAKSMKKNPIIKVAGSGHATDTIALHSRDDITFLRATAEAARRAFDMAGVGPKDIDFAEVHDCFSIAEICVSEALGFFEKGQGGKAAEAGETRLGGEIPINPSGGLKAKGHPVGATGIAQVHELVTQLRQDAGKRQVKNARRALSQNMGGTGGSALVHILEVA